LVCDNKIAVTILFFSTFEWTAIEHNKSYNYKVVAPMQLCIITLIMFDRLQSYFWALPFLGQ